MPVVACIDVSDRAGPSFRSTVVVRLRLDSSRQTPLSKISCDAGNLRSGVVEDCSLLVDHTATDCSIMLVVSTGQRQHIADALVKCMEGLCFSAHPLFPQRLTGM